MRQHTALLLLLAVAALAPMNASAAAHGQFSVGVQVVSSAPADRALLASVPAPVNAVVMLAGRNARHHVYSGPLAQAADFFRSALPASGWHLVKLGGDGEHTQEQVWESSHGRVVVRLQAALGSSAATRISLSASAHQRGV